MFCALNHLKKVSGKVSHFPDIFVYCGRTGFSCELPLSEKVDLVGYLVIIDKVGEQADNGQYAENDFAWVQTFTSFQLSEKFSTASMIKSTTAPTAWKIGPSGIISNISFP